MILPWEAPFFSSLKLVIFDFHNDWRNRPGGVYMLTFKNGSKYEFLCLGELHIGTFEVSFAFSCGF